MAAAEWKVSSGYGPNKSQFGTFVKYDINNIFEEDDKQFFKNRIYCPIQDAVNRPSIDLEVVARDVSLDGLISMLPDYKGGNMNGHLSGRTTVFEELNAKKYGFSWWQLAPDITQADRYREALLGETCQAINTGRFFHDQSVRIPMKFNWNEDNKQFLCNSLVFKEEESAYGNYRLIFDINRLLEDYKRSLGCREVEFHILGTTKYACELMYSVLIVPKSSEVDVPAELQTLPTVPKGDSSTDDMPIRISSLGSKIKMHWHPYSTSSEFAPGKYRRWDHVALAFYLPPEAKLHSNLEKKLKIVRNDIEPKQRASGDGWNSKTAKEKFDGKGLPSGLLMLTSEATPDEEFSQKASVQN